MLLTREYHDTGRSVTFPGKGVNQGCHSLDFSETVYQSCHDVEYIHFQEKQSFESLKLSGWSWVVDIFITQSHQTEYSRLIQAMHVKMM